MALQADDTLPKTGALKIKSVKWNIGDFFDTEEEYLDSSEFSLFNAMWCIRIYPHAKPYDAESGDDDDYDYNTDFDDDSYISVYLVKTSGSLNCQVSFSLELQTGHYIKSILCKNTVWNELSRKGKLYFIKRTTLETRLEEVKDTIITVICTFYLDQWTPEQEFSVKSIEMLSTNFEDLFLNGRQSDVTIKVGDREFQAHKAVLVTRSPVFSSMLEHNMAEKNSSVIVINDCDPTSFKDFLKFLYSGKLNVSPNRAMSLYKICDKYDVKELKDTCGSVIASEMSVDMVLDSILFAKLYEESEIWESAIHNFIKYCEEIFDTKKWITFLSEHAMLANDLLKKVVKKKKGEASTATHLCSKCDNKLEK